ncbi:hypothetical protein LAD54_27645 [Klebsiella pneumoniae]|nr:hypothetical protein [Klebsiella pneumoniae]
MFETLTPEGVGARKGKRRENTSGVILLQRIEGLQRFGVLSPGING